MEDLRYSLYVNYTSIKGDIDYIASQQVEGKQNEKIKLHTE